MFICDVARTSAVRFGGELTVLKNRFVPAKCADYPTANLAPNVEDCVDVGNATCPPSQFFSFLKIDNRQVGILADGDAAFLRNIETLRDIFVC